MLRDSHRERFAKEVRTRTETSPPYVATSLNNHCGLVGRNTASTSGEYLIRVALQELVADAQDGALWDVHVSLQERHEHLDKPAEVRGALDLIGFATSLSLTCGLAPRSRRG